MAITVIAADIYTGTLLDEAYAWHTGKPEQKQFERHFEDEADADTFCQDECERHPDVEFWLSVDGAKRRRVVSKKWSR